MIEFVKHAINLATMRVESKVRVAYRLFGNTRFYPEQFVDGGIVDAVDTALFAFRKLEEDGKLRIILTVKSGDVLVYQGDAAGFIARGDPGDGAVVTLWVDMTDEWRKELDLEA